MNLLSVYESILNLGGLSTNDDGFISVTLAGDSRPAIITVKEDKESFDKRLVLPTTYQLRAEGGWENRIAFHPLKENIINGESRVVEYLRKAINFRINMVTQSLFDHILTYASSPEYQKSLTSEKIKLLDAAKDADETMRNNFDRVMKKISPVDTKNSFVSIFLKKLGKIGDKDFSCVATINFPFYKELIQSEKEFHGVKLRKVDFATFKSIMEYIFPGIDEKGNYNVGVSDSIAPFTEGLIRATDKLTQEMNRVTEILFKKSTHIPKTNREELYEFAYFKNDHMSTFESLESLLPEIRIIPQLPGNEDKEAKSITPPMRTLSDIQNTQYEHSEEVEETMTSPPRRQWETLSNTSVPTPSPQEVFNQQHPKQQGKSSTSGEPRSLHDATWANPYPQQYPGYTPQANQVPVANVRQGALAREYSQYGYNNQQPYMNQYPNQFPGYPPNQSPYQQYTQQYGQYPQNYPQYGNPYPGYPVAPMPNLYPVR